MLLHLLRAQATDGLAAMQAAHRDFSPFLVHFTSMAKMKPLSSLAASRNIVPREIKDLFETCDAACHSVFKCILDAGEIRTSLIRDAQGTLPVVCLSEGNLPGLVSHAERYGRFGFVFRKEALFRLGARPCAYFDKKLYTEIKAQGKSPTARDHDRRLYSLANMFIPKCAKEPGFKPIDFTHEREWRSFENIKLSSAVAVICPDVYFSQTREALDNAALQQVKLFGLDMLIDWGA